MRPQSWPVLTVISFLLLLPIAVQCQGEFALQLHVYTVHTAPEPFLCDRTVSWNMFPACMVELVGDGPVTDEGLIFEHTWFLCFTYYHKSGVGSSYE